MAESAMHWKVTVAVSVGTVVYSLIGGAIFHAIEYENEVTLNREINNEFNKFLEAHPSVSRAQLQKFLKRYYNAFRVGIVNYGNSTSSNKNWNFYNSFFFSVTVITSIGYGNVTPATQAGRSFTVAFALFGIPLMLVALAGMGQQQNRLMTCIRQRLFARHGCHSGARCQHVVSAIIKTIIGLTLFIYVPAAIFMAVEKDWTYQEAIYFCFTTLLTCGFGDYVAGWRESGNSDASWVLYRLLIAAWIIIGLSWVNICLNSYQQTYLHFVKKTETAAELVRSRLRSGLQRESSKTSNVTETSGENAQSSEDNDGIRESNATIFDDDGTTRSRERNATGSSVSSETCLVVESDRAEENDAVGLQRVEAGSVEPEPRSPEFLQNRRNSEPFRPTFKFRVRAV